MRSLRFIFAIGLLVGVLGGWGLARVEFAPAVAQDKVAASPIPEQTAQSSTIPEAKAQSTAAPEHTAQMSPTAESAVEVVKQVGDSVVTVVNQQIFQGFDTAQPVGSGTGFIIDKDGHIVTNWHVVDGGTSFLVILANGDRRPATLVGSDAISDLAVVQIKGDLPGIAGFGDSDALQVGETVLAIGSPLGTFTNTVTEGIVSGLGRDLPQSNYTNLIQHDAPINPGNSGGPLLNMEGQVVGVNTLGLSVDDNGQPIQGLFFALPGNQVQSIVSRLIESGKVAYPFFGITYQTINWQNAAQANLPVDNGIYVTQVSAGGPAEKAGIQAGDIIVSIDGVKIDAQNAFSEVLFMHKPGDTIKVELLRDNKSVTVSLTLVERPANT